MKADFRLDYGVSEESGQEGKHPLGALSPDTLLWTRFQSGDPDAYEEIYVKHIPSLYRYGLRLTDDPDLVKDSVQEIFMELWDKRENLGKVSAIRPYLYTVLRRKLLARAQGNARWLQLEEENENQLQASGSPESEIIASERSAILSGKLREAVKKLNSRQQELLHLKYHARLNNMEIAEITGMHSKKVSYHIRTAIGILQGMMYGKDL